MGFADTSADKAAVGFNRALQEMLTTDLAVSRDVRIVERGRLEEVLKEQDLGKTEFLDKASAAKVGRGVGADAVLTGSVWVQEDDMRIDVRLVHVETGEILLPEQVQGDKDSFLDLEKQIAAKIVDALGARLSAFDKASLSKRHTTNFSAATSLGQALQAEDDGDALLARVKASAALAIDPQLALAERLVKGMDEVLNAAKTEDAENRAGFLASFEFHLFSWPLEDAEWIPEKYRSEIDAQRPHRALLHWIINAKDNVLDATATPYSMLFASAHDMARDQGAGRNYLDAFAGDVVTFWCDVAQSDPDLAPRRALSEKELNPDFRTLPARGNGRSYYLWRLPDIYTKRFLAEVRCDGDMSAAAQIAKEYADVCRNMGPEATLYPELEALRQQVADPASRQRLFEERRQNRLRWSIMEQAIIDWHLSFQTEHFRDRDTTLANPDSRRQLLHDIEAHAGDWPALKQTLLKTCEQNPTEESLNNLAKLCEAACRANSTDREQQSLTLRCLATVATTKDVPRLAELLKTSPFFDVRANAGSVLGCIDDAKARDALTAAIANEPYYFVRHSLKASFARSLGKHWAALSKAATALTDQGKTSDAIDALSSLVDEISRSDSASRPKSRWLGSLHRTLGDMVYATAYETKGPLDKVAAHYRQAVALLIEDTPNTAATLNSLAYVLVLQRKDLEAAEQAVRRAISIQNRFSEADSSLDDTYMLSTLALVLFERGQLEEAKQVATKCVSRPAGQNLECYELLGDILWALNDTAGAKAAWEKGLPLAGDADSEKRRAIAVQEKLARQ
jgi:TolB-like protein/predicted negative regulator of RcsB-dependent stress response